MFSCILVEPESPGNIGSIARLMANFDIKGPLILVNPCKITDEAYMMACNAKSVLDNAFTVKEYREALELVDFSIATSREAGDEYNVNRIAVLPEDIAKSLDIDGNIGIVFGRESAGLTNREIEISDILVTLPSCEDYPTLNVSHAAAIIFYELFRHDKCNGPFKLKKASRKEKEMLFDDFKEIVANVEHRQYRNKLANVIFRRVISRGFISSREAYTLKGILGKVLKKIK
ncbi:MAG: RNA methyltransferase [Candidatus Methanofastidiosia archaeon]